VKVVDAEAAAVFQHNSQPGIFPCDQLWTFQRDEYAAATAIAAAAAANTIHQLVAGAHRQKLFI